MVVLKISAGIVRFVEITFFLLHYNHTWSLQYRLYIPYSLNSLRGEFLADFVVLEATSKKFILV